MIKDGEKIYILLPIEILKADIPPNAKLIGAIIHSRDFKEKNYGKRAKLNYDNIGKVLGLSRRAVGDNINILKKENFILDFKEDKNG